MWFTLEELKELAKILVPLFSALGIGFGALWQRVTKTMDEQKEDLKKCHEGRDEANAKLMGLTERVGRLEGRIEGQTQGVLELAEAVIAKVNEGR